MIIELTQYQCSILIRCLSHMLMHPDEVDIEGVRTLVTIFAPALSEVT